MPTKTDTSVYVLLKRCVNICSITINNSSELESMQLSIHKIDMVIVMVVPFNGVLHGNEKE